VLKQKALLTGNLQKPNKFHYSIYQQHPVPIARFQKANFDKDRPTYSVHLHNRAVKITTEKSIYLRLVGFLVDYMQPTRCYVRNEEKGIEGVVRKTGQATKGRVKWLSLSIRLLRTLRCHIRYGKLRYPAILWSRKCRINQLLIYIYIYTDVCRCSFNTLLNFAVDGESGQWHAPTPSLRGENPSVSKRQVKVKVKVNLTL
jgi:hypothetical protein